MRLAAFALGGAATLAIWPGAARYVQAHAKSRWPVFSAGFQPPAVGAVLAGAALESRTEKDFTMNAHTPAHQLLAEAGMTVDAERAGQLVDQLERYIADVRGLAFAVGAIAGSHEIEREPARALAVLAERIDAELQRAEAVRQEAWTLLRPNR